MTPPPPLLPAYTIARWLILFIALAGVYFLRGFLVPLLAALIIGLASWPLYQQLVDRCRQNRSVAATLALVIVLVVLIVPLAIALNFAIQEASSFIGWALMANREGVAVPLWISEMPFFGPRLSELWQEHLGEPQALGTVVQLVSGEHLGNIYRMVLSATGNVFHLVLTVVFMLIILFFVYKDGHYFVDQLDVVGERVLPRRWQRFSRVVPATINSTVTGMTLIAIGEGVVLGLAYWIAGVPSPALIGAVTGVMALIPGGAPLSVTIVSLYLVGSGNTVAGVVLFIWGAVELFVVDKTIRPKLVGGPVRLPFLPTFFGLVGGVQTMGLVGLFIGPVLMALLVAIWREWLYVDPKTVANDAIL